MRSSLDADISRRDSLVNRVENFSIKKNASLRSSHDRNRTPVGSRTHVGNQFRNIDHSTETNEEANIRSSRAIERRQGGVFHNRVNSTDRYSFMEKDPNIRPSHERSRSHVRTRNRPNSTEIFALGAKDTIIRSSHNTDRTHVGISHSRLNSADNLSMARHDTNKSAVSLANTIVQGDIGDSSWLTGNSFGTERDFDFDFDFDVEKGHKKGDDAGGPPVPPKKEPKEQKNPDLVEWDGPGDPENPMNWKPAKKWIITLTLGFMTFCVTFASSVFSNATIPTAKLFHVSPEVTTLGTSLFVLGFAVGPLVWGPCSEIFGRKRPLFFGYFCFAIFQIPVAVSQNLYTIMLCRFFGGCFASAPLGIVGGTLADFFGPVDRGVAICVFAGATFIGPIAGPIMGGFITDSYLDWRWTAYITLIMASFFGLVGLLVVPETSHPRILQQRANKIRFETQNWTIHSKADTVNINPKAMVQTYLFRPFIMLAKEPILLLLTLYMSLVYGILYLFFEAYPISFQEERGWNAGVGALPFIDIGVGVLVGCLTITWMTKTRFARKLKKHGKVIPEERLIPMILGSFLLPIGLFWFAWSSSPHISWVPQALAGVPIGWGILMIFLQGLNYIIDVYLWYANSAIAANTFLRSISGAGFPLFAGYMFRTLGVQWATSLLGFLCIAMIPAPLCFFFFGSKIRKISKFSPTA